MKRGIISALFVLLITCSVVVSSFAQTSVPGTVSGKFTAMFPQASDINWNVYGTIYRVSFTDGISKAIVFYDESGNFKRSMTNITLAELPSPASQYVNDHYAGQTISNVRLLKSANGETQYQVFVDNNVVPFSASGELLSEVTAHK